MLFEIKHRFTGSVLFSLECGSLKLCVEAAIKSRANLTRADLSEADLTRADLSEADLTRADLSRANLSRANLSRANLYRADLTRADLSRADLYRADLTRADLSRADLAPIRDDFWAVLASAPKEVEGLRKALIDGRVDGSTYEGECACLVGTIANLRNDDYRELGALKPNSARPIERFFMNISKGDLPETNQACSLAVQWTDEFLFNMRQAFGAKE